MVKKCHLGSIELLVVLFVSGSTGHPALVEAGVVSGESLAAVAPHPVHALRHELYQA